MYYRNALLSRVWCLCVVRGAAQKQSTQRRLCYERQMTQSTPPHMLTFFVKSLWSSCMGFRSDFTHGAVSPDTFCCTLIACISLNAIWTRHLKVSIPTTYDAP